MKNNEILLDVLNDIDQSLIPDVNYEEKHYRRKWPYLIGALVVMLVIFILLVPYLMLRDPRGAYGRLDIRVSPVVKDGVEKFPSKVIFKEGMSEIYKIDEIIVDKELIINELDNLSKLPLYKDLRFAENIYLSKEDINSILDRVVKLMQVKKPLLSYKEQGVTAECENGVIITVTHDGIINIRFKEITSEESSVNGKGGVDDGQKLIKELNDRYQKLLGMRNPVWYYAPGKQWGNSECGVYYVFDDKGSAREKAINWHLHYAAFYIDGNNSLVQLTIYNYFCTSEYMGDYPIITMDKAKELLFAGHYYTSCKEEYLKSESIGDKDIVKADIVYLVDDQEFYQPYYKFYVELDKEKIDIGSDEKVYGTFFVPAVNGEYLSDYNIFMGIQ